MDTDQRILERFIKEHTLEAIKILEGLKETEIGNLIQDMPVTLAAILIQKMDAYMSIQLLEKIRPDETLKLIACIEPTLAVLLLRKMNPDLSNLILKELPEDLSKTLQQTLNYPADTLGAYFDPKIIAFHDDLIIDQVIDRIKLNPSLVLETVFVINREHELVGFTTIKNLIATKKSKTIRTMMDPNPPKLIADLNIDFLLKKNGWIEPFNVLPVVNSQGIYLGIITRETLSRINREETSSDILAREASVALGNLFQIGFSSLFRSAAEIILEDQSKQ